MDMIKNLSRRYAIKSIMFEDDNFVLDKNRLYELLDMMRREGIDLRWSCNARVGTVNKEMLKEMKSSGCWQILYGIESGSQKILNLLKKNITLGQIEDSIKITKQAGIQTKGFIMFGNPNDTIQSIEKTINFIKKIDLDDVSITYFTPYPGTEIFNSINSFGELDNDWSKMSCFEPVFIPKGLNKFALEGLLKSAYRKFYFRKKIIGSYVKKIKSFRKAWFYLLSALSLFLLTRKAKFNFN